MQELGPNQLAWVEALESGEFRQCRFTMTDSIGGFCCLGVAGLIAGIDMDSGEMAIYHAVQNWLGLRSGNGKILGGNTLVEMNDTDRYSFNGIAKLVREDPERCFAESK